MEYVTDSERYEKWLLSKGYEMMKEKYNIFKKKKSICTQSILHKCYLTILKSYFYGLINN